MENSNRKRKASADADTPRKRKSPKTQSESGANQTTTSDPAAVSAPIPTLLNPYPQPPDTLIYVFELDEMCKPPPHLENLDPLNYRSNPPPIPLVNPRQVERLRNRVTNFGVTCDGENQPVTIYTPDQLAQSVFRQRYRISLRTKIHWDRSSHGYNSQADGQADFERIFKEEEANGMLRAKALGWDLLQAEIKEMSLQDYLKSDHALSLKTWRKC